MAKSILMVESKPVSPDRLEEYHRWHDETHLPEMLGIDGFVSARRWETEDATYITLYEIDTDVDTARTNLKSAFGSGRMSPPPEAVQTDPPAVMRYLTLVSETPA